MQYIRFLQDALPEEEYAKLLPPIDVQRREYGLDPEVVFTLFRPLLRRLLFLTNPLPEDGELEEGEEGMVSDAKPSNDVATPAADVAKGPEPEVAGFTWSSMVASMRAGADSEALSQSMAAHMYSSFWTLDVTDIYVPQKRYQEEVLAVEAELSHTERQLSSQRSPYMPPGMMGYGNSGTASNAAAGAADLDNLKRHRAHLQDLLAKLKSECEAQNKHVAEVRMRLDRDKAQLFGSGAGKRSGKPNQEHVSIVEECVLPRMLFSPEDALYSAKFPALLHSLDTPGFSTLLFYNELLRTVPHVLKCVTVREGANMGIFLRETFQLLSHWRSNESVYARECEARVGFAINFSGDLSGRKTSYEQFTKLMNKWHNICSQIFQSCLRNEEWTSRRNALAVLTSVVEYFPVVTEHFNALKKLTEGMRDTEQREDLKKLAQGYLNLLEREGSKPDRLFPAVQWGGAPPSKGARAKPTAPAVGSGPAPKEAKETKETKDAKDAKDAKETSDTAASKDAKASQLRADARAFQPLAPKRDAAVVESGGGSGQKRTRHGDGELDSGGGVEPERADDPGREEKRRSDDRSADRGAERGAERARDGDRSRHAAGGRKRPPDAAVEREAPRDQPMPSRDQSRDRTAREPSRDRASGGVVPREDGQDVPSKRRRAEPVVPATEKSDLRMSVLGRNRGSDAGAAGAARDRHVHDSRAAAADASPRVDRQSARADPDEGRPPKGPDASVSERGAAPPSDTGAPRSRRGARR